MAGPIRLGSVSLDCADSHQLASFYSKFLKKEIAYDVEGLAAIRLDNIWLLFLSVENYEFPTWTDSIVPRQVHLDFAVTDLKLAESAALELGAVRIRAQASMDRWVVFLDPAGHPFCISSLIPAHARRFSQIPDQAVRAFRSEETL